MFTFLHAIYWSAPPIWRFGRLNKQNMIRSGIHLPSNYKTALPKCTLLWLSSAPVLIAQYVWPSSLTALIRSILSWDMPKKREKASNPPLFQEMVGNRLSRLGTLSACSCGFKDLPCSCHVARQWDCHCPKSLEWHLRSRWGLLYGRTLHRWRCSQAQCVTKRSNFSCDFDWSS